MGQANLAAGGQGAVSLAGLVAEQAGAFGGLEQAVVDLLVVEGAGGDQVVEVAGGFPQPLVALTPGSGGDSGQLLGECRLPIARCRLVAHRDRDGRGGSVGLAMLQPLQEGSGHSGHRGIQVPAGDPQVRVAGGVAAGWGDDIAAPAPPIHPLEVAGTDVAQAGRGEIVMPPAAPVRTSGPELCR
jgi:hypothetical protein